ncbi:dual specificity protein kinase Ttk [Callorhinchus milii]|uniref:TTK protein kinase n=1 Tax=Callorhinchus milii TaxID=7868 RepID=V9KC47_CALMI|nr:dual specificity protein kinase Ttk [Callorhinchus milii]XP_007903239.1 dual specificity protein kinase Ttk [Callorhinchus milii]XP_042189496.1 dual specificity protein kinase Ttk [Callorhinchus milii]|eukprot:gi/632973615/ref/XP_007903238.1/ PREDICTED: dual specificity protein kinase TTK [Callorhinchus milii]
MEDEVSESRLRLARLTSRLADLKTKYEEANKTEELRSSLDITDHTGTIRQIMSAGNCPEDWLAYLQKVEKMGDPQTNTSLLNKLLELYDETVAALPVERHAANESYARILVRFAELKAFVDMDEAQEQFNLGRVNCKKFAFVHIAHAQFQLNRACVKKCRTILQKAVDVKAEPIELLEVAFYNLNKGKMLLVPPDEGDKKNVSVTMIQSKPTFLPRDRKNSDSSGELQHGPISSLRVDNGDFNKENNVPCGQNLFKQFKKTAGNKISQTVSVPMQPIMTDSVTGLKTMDVASVNISMKAMRVSVSSLPQTNSEDEDSHGYECDVMHGSSIPISRDSQRSEKHVQKADISPVFFKTGLKKQEASQKQIVHPNEMGFKESKMYTNYSAESAPAKKKKISATGFGHVSPETGAAIFEKTGSMFAPKRVLPTGGVGKTAGPPVSLCQTPSTKVSGYYTTSMQTPVMNKSSMMPQFSTPCNFPPVYQHPGPHTPATPYQRHDQLPQYGSSQHPPLLEASGSFAANENVVIKGRVYMILKLIGTGGSSKVFQVLDQKKQLYAIKFVNLEDADPQTVAGYKNEIEYLARLQKHSDKIIRLFDFEITESYIYMVMECGNIDLNTFLRKKKVINPLERKCYWKNILEAVHTIHQHGIIHSDLKPANFLMVEGMLKLIDFGIANQIQPDVTSIIKDAQVGTLNFMAPEAIKDMSSYGENGKARSKISPKSDVWSLGCILYYMTYGKTPFQHITNQISKLQAIIDPSHEIQFAAIAERDLLDVLKRCLVRNPKERLSVVDLLDHPYLCIQTRQQHSVTEPGKESRKEIHRIFSQLMALNSPNSITRATRGLLEQCNSGRNLDVSAFVKPSSHNH